VRLLYWDDFDCTEETRRIARAETVHVHTDDETELAVAFQTHARQYPALHDQGQRYHCFRGPGGLVRDVVP